MSTKFDTVESTAAALVANKKPDCVVALNVLFYQALEDGKTPREAYVYAEATHFLNDHDGYNHLPELVFAPTDENVYAAIKETADETDSQEQGELLRKWYDVLRSWNVPVSLAFITAAHTSTEEWEETHDLDEAEAIGFLNEIPTGDDGEGEEIKDAALKTFYAERNAGNSVRASLREAKAQAQQALELQFLFSILGGGISN